MFATRALASLTDDFDELSDKYISQFSEFLLYKLDEILSSTEDNEISMKTYLKIYENFEFGIEETEFRFYEEEINKSDAIELKENRSNLLKKLTSNFFKKGTFVWISKKIEDRLKLHIEKGFRDFKQIFSGNEHKFAKLVEKFISRYVDFIKERLKFNKSLIDSHFFSLGVNAFKHTFGSLTNNDLFANILRSTSEKLINMFILKTIDAEMTGLVEKWTLLGNSNDFDYLNFVKPVEELTETAIELLIYFARSIWEIGIGEMLDQQGEREQFRYFFVCLNSILATLTGADKYTNLSRKAEFQLVFHDRIYFDLTAESNKRNLLNQKTEFSSRRPHIAALRITRKLMQNGKVLVDRILKTNSHFVFP